nr:immunoglobulin heavy chain junction region [Macaca mulatta]MOV48873.1 immunoglobulin heavy chain junction region [Macaca mulatta]MOV49617.1 immunoglobulin heavy chain junction region [Macaca mulatta]MOV50199.1 immunoglobulin heavy chain junction region [Macaca mulatta]MOV50320.1 immunoglobulin heavy chain junction region [Macaca mulatta]
CIRGSRINSMDVW